MRMNWWMDGWEDEGVRDGAIEGREERGGWGFTKRFTRVYVGFGNLYFGGMDFIWRAIR